MAYPVSGSTLSPKINTGLATQIIISVEGEHVGAIQSLQITHTRNNSGIKEVGLDGFLEIVPNQPTTYDVSVERIVFDRLRLPEAFARGFINIKSQVLPFDILILDRSNGDGEGLIKHTLINCWFKSYVHKYASNDYILTESGSLTCEDIATSLGNTGESAVQGGARGIVYQVNDRERQTDTGSGGSELGAGFRGSLDVTNLLNQVFKS
jgi:hypothetical protein